MKRNKNIILILFIFISSFSLIGCKMIIQYFYQPTLKLPGEDEWINFRTGLKEVIDNYFSVESEITIDMFEDACLKNKYPDDSCYEELTDDEKSEFYLNNDQKINKYQKWQNDFKNLPILENDSYKEEINNYLNSMRLWIIYKHFWNKNEFEREFDEIFEFSLSLNNKHPKFIKTKDSNLNEIFGINWEYEIEKKDAKNPKKIIKEYNNKTQEYLFEFISYHKYIENQFHKNLCINIEKYPENIDKSRYYRELVDYEKYIDLNYYNEWLNREENKKYLLLVKKEKRDKCHEETE